METNLDIDSLALVPKEITSSTLTTRLKGICKINRLIDHINELSHHHHQHNQQQQQLRPQQLNQQKQQQTSQQQQSSPPPRPNTPAPAPIVSPEATTLNHEKFQSDIHKFREWIIENEIIEHIFGPNCHVEIIKQSHTILNFVAQSLHEDHVDVIWSAASLKHCGRQVLDLLTSLVRFMQTGPVLHLYVLVKSLNTEEHSEHTFLLTSHILRYIWSHSPCINQIHLCNFQNHHASANNLDSHETLPPTNNQQQELHQIYAKDAVQSSVHQLQQPSKRQGSTTNSSKNLKMSVVEHILKTISDSPTDNQQKPSQDQDVNTNSDEKKWLTWQQSKDEDLYDNYSDVGACCSEEKNMDDFEDDLTNFDDESAFEIGTTSSNPSPPTADDISHSDLILGLPDEKSNNNDKDSHEENYSLDSIDSEVKFQQQLNEQAIPNLNLTSSEAIKLFKELKKTSNNLSFFTKQFSSDDELRRLADHNLTNLCDPGKTLLWDLLQDGHIEYLAQNLNSELENVLVNLIMSFGDRNIRFRFIEACLENLTHGKSVTISLKLAPKLMSFNTITRNLSSPAINETHAIVSWAEQEYHLSENFFRNLVQYYNDRDDIDEEDMDTKTVFSHIDEVITRMSFLTFIYSKPFSPDEMKLSQKQVIQLWDCLASDDNPRCSDVLFQWIYQQAVGEDFHGINDELLDYILKTLLPSLSPELFRLRGLKLLEQLLWIRQEYECCHSLDHPATKLLWDIALKAADDEVSMAAIRILNHFYIYTNHTKPTKCDKGLNFMNYCMEQLQTSLTQIISCDETSVKGLYLDVMQKVILLIRTHLEVFKLHWSYYLRILQLNNEVDLISHRLMAYDIKLPMIIRLNCQAAASMDKTIIEMQPGDFIGELRAEIVKWWYTHVDRSYFDQFNNSSMQQSPKSSPSVTESEGDQSTSSKIPESNENSLSSFTEFLLANHQSIKLLSHQQEIPFEWDERQINELDFKDMQVIYVLGDVKTGSSIVDNPMCSDDMSSDKSNELSGASYIPRSEIPSLLLLRQECFDRLLEVDRYLGSFRCDNTELVNRAKALSKRVWEIIQILPTSHNYIHNIKQSGIKNAAASCSDSPQKLLYSLQTIDILKSSRMNPAWGSTFIQKGGLADIFDIFMAEKLLPDSDGEWNEWLQECLAYLLKLIFQFGIRPTHNLNDTSSSSSSSRMSVSTTSSRVMINNTNSGIKKTRRNRARHLGSVEESSPIPRLSDELLALLHKTSGSFFERLERILECSAFCKNNLDQYYYVTMSTRAMIIHHVMSLFASWLKSDLEFPKFDVSKYENLFRSLILEDHDPSARREISIGLYRLHHACATKLTSNASIESIHSIDSSKQNQDIVHQLATYDNRSLSCDLLDCLIKFLPIAEEMKPPKPIRTYTLDSDYLKDLNAPSCKDYFWLTCKLIDSIQNPVSKENTQYSDLCEYLVNAVRKRRYYETRDFTVEDDTLRGMLMMMVMTIKRDPTFRYTETAYEFIKELYKHLFQPPDQKRRYLPKCKSPTTRSTAFDLMIVLVERCPKNYFLLLDLLITDHHNLVVKNTYPSDYWPHDDCRNEVGFVGLINLGATCYLATCMQHLFMIPTLRYAVLSIEDTKEIRHGDIIRELQKIFTFMLESERKAYNPKNFCKVYTMDNHPLNITEQTDMTEFFTDLITKLEESSPELKQIIKGLFSGTLSNNVVSLDCPHISRTSEEFYTLRVQVADMRSLNDSLDELTIKDTLDGDNMYTCSTCQKKVRAEKRACIVKLPRILCFNTMRYTFNMATMTKEKVNTHFSFPLKIDMTDYLEENLMKRQQTNGPNTMADDESNVYELIGVTVHTGNADGGHYYCFIRDCEDKTSDKPKWYLFNDAEVKPFDDSHIGTECYGGELTTKSYDAINDRFMDFSIEKTNSAYMLFYKRVDYKYYSKSVAQRYLESDMQRESLVQDDNHNDQHEQQQQNHRHNKQLDSSNGVGDLEFNDNELIKQPSSPLSEMISRFRAKSAEDGEKSLDSNAFSQHLYEEFQLPKHLVNWIWADNMKFHRDKNVFDTNYFTFMWQIYANIPKTLNQIPEHIKNSNPNSPFVVQASEDNLAIRTTHLAITFVLGVLLNSRDTSNVSNWTELIKKQFSCSKAACDWLMDLIDGEDTWLKQMLFRCPIDVVRQLFQRFGNDLVGTKQHKKLRLIR